MTQGFQIGTTGHPPEWHVLLKTERRNDRILLYIVFLTMEVHVEKKVFKKCVQKNPTPLSKTKELQM